MNLPVRLLAFLLPSLRIGVWGVKRGLRRYNLEIHGSPVGISLLSTIAPPTDEPTLYGTFL
jgi:hypothetical protein